MTNNRQLGLAMIGIGVGGTEMLPAMESMPELRLVAGCDVNEETLGQFIARYNAKGYGDYDEMLADPEVEAVWVSTPNRFHAEHSIRAMEAGKHVVVEKPMALNLEDAEKMVETANRTGVKFLAGHTRSFTPPVRTMWKIIQSGAIGRARAINAFAYTDWMLRPRTWEELDIEQGGGLPMRQLPHQIDSVRLLGGGMVKSVRGATGQWMPERAIPGYYAAFLEFQDGTTSLVCHNGYGYVMGAEFVTWGHDRQRYTAEERVEVRRQMREGVRDESADKQALRIGGLQEREVLQSRERGTLGARGPRPAHRDVRAGRHPPRPARTHPLRRPRHARDRPLHRPRHGPRLPARGARGTVRCGDRRPPHLPHGRMGPRDP